jgi:hypothetical protein
MNPPDPDSSKEYDPYELFSEELDLDTLGLESPSPEQTAIPLMPQEQDEDRLYTDEVIQQNETASRFLFLSVIAAGVLSLGIGVWYLLAQKPTPPPPNAPLPVPDPLFQSPQPGLSLPPNAPPNATVPPRQTLPPSNSGAIPGGQPSPRATLPAQPNAVNGGTSAPPPPPLPPQTSGQ